MTDETKPISDDGRFSQSAVRLGMLAENFIDSLEVSEWAESQGDAMRRLYAMLNCVASEAAAKARSEALEDAAEHMFKVWPLESDMAKRMSYSIRSLKEKDV